MKVQYTLDEEEWDEIQEELNVLRTKKTLYIRHIAAIEIEKARLVRELRQYKEDPIVAQVVPPQPEQPPQLFQEQLQQQIARQQQPSPSTSPPITNSPIFVDYVPNCPLKLPTLKITVPEQVTKKRGPGRPKKNSVEPN